ncbi:MULTISPECIES: hypothetical protein [Pasteurellaceae]|uniref:hypothetical protein n=1 Tax=Pasteurellaceae TaxID=712 RepID=UPI00356697B0
MMSNANIQINEENRNKATLWGIYAIIERIEQFSNSAMTGHVSTLNPDGTKTPVQPNEVFNLINEMANLALMDIQALRQEFERLATSKTQHVMTKI